MQKSHKPYKVHVYTQEHLGNALVEIAKGKSIGQVSTKYRRVRGEKRQLSRELRNQTTRELLFSFAF